MGEISLEVVGLLTLEQAAKRRGVSTRTVERWRDEHGLNAVVLGSGRRKTYLFRPVDVDAFTPPPRGAPEGNRNAAKNSDSQNARNSSTPKVSPKKSRKR